MAYIDAIYAHAFNLLVEFGPSRLYKLGQYFGSFEQAFEANEIQLIKSGIEPEIAKKFLQFRISINLSKEEEDLRKENIWLLTYKDKNYPKLLLEIPKLPPLLYVKGKLDDSEEACLAVVGTRKISNYGRTVTPQLIEPLIKSGLIIVSGMAYGVDEMVHELSVQNGKRTIAVLGGGLDNKSIYPKNHQLLADKILQANGALISEYPIGIPNLRHHFVTRNRIISGLSLGTLVIECDLDSGSLITAKHALEQNRTVFAVPGPIYSEVSKGPNNLIKMGARLVTEANDILEDLNLQKLEAEEEAQDLFGDTPEESAVIKILSREPISINEIIKQSGLNTGQATSALTFLEMKGKIRNLGGQQYILSR